MPKASSLEQGLVWKRLADQSLDFYESASEQEREMFRDWVRGLLRTTTIEITFDKANGEQRRMSATLMPGLLPRTAGGSTTSDPDQVCVVWDPTRGVWRSFCWHRLRALEFHLG